MIINVTDPRNEHPTHTVEITDYTGRVLWSGTHRSEGWEQFALCRDDDALVDRMYSDSTAVAQEAADQVCGHCPARAACLEAGLSRAENFGVWGGIPATDPLFRELAADRAIRVNSHAPELEEA